MKRVLSTSLVMIFFAAMVSISGCTKEAIIVKYTVNTQNACLEANTLAEKARITYFTVTQDDIKAAFSSAGATWDYNRITTATFKNMEAEIVTNGVNFGKIGGVEVYVKDGNDSLQVGYTQNLSSSATSAVLAMNGPQLKEWLSKTQFQLVVKVWNGSTVTTQESCVKIKSGIMDIELRND